MKNPPPIDVQLRLPDGSLCMIPYEWITGEFPKGTFKIRRARAWIEGDPSPKELSLQKARETRAKYKPVA